MFPIPGAIDVHDILFKPKSFPNSRFGLRRYNLKIMFLHCTKRIYYQIKYSNKKCIFRPYSK